MRTTTLRLLALSLPLALLLGACDDDPSDPPVSDSLVVVDAAADQSMILDGPVSDQLFELPPVLDGPASTPDTALDLSLKPDQATPLDTGNACDAAKQAVCAEMKKINTCAVDSDCAFEYGACPFGCYIPRNTNASAVTLQQLMAAFKAMKQCPQCVYKCAAPGPLTCVGGACTMN
jgi:hypothetical protein